VKTLLRSFLLTAAVASIGTAASAQGFFIEGAGGYQDLTRAKDSAKAVFDGSSGGFTFGGGAGFDFGNGLFVSGWFRSFSKDGERVFVESPGGPVFPLGHPLTLKLRPIQGTIGYRFAHGKSISPYLGIGGGVTKVEETSTVGGLEESSSESKGSFHALAGVELGGGSVSVGAEVMYLSIPDSAGLGGVSAVYGEDDLGGFSAVAKLRFRFGH
jgi:opacity protein-like surface antigen